MSDQPQQLIIIDVEATCWESSPPPEQQSEIIEIGVCVFNMPSREITDRRSILVKPQRSKVSPFCTQLTTLTQEQVDGGIGFDEACALLQADYHTAAHPWSSWGSYDQRIFETQCASFGVPYPFGGKHINLKNLFAKTLNHRNRVGMTQALEIAGLTLEGTHHRGDDDAWNIARLLDHMVQKRGEKLLHTYW